jgi:hypothetical protein
MTKKTVRHVTSQSLIQILDFLSRLVSRNLHFISSQVGMSEQSPVDRNAALRKPKSKWSPEEDKILERAIEHHGASNWNVLARVLPGRTGKQCRERWFSKLSPGYTTEMWTPEEDRRLITLQSERGNKWSRFQLLFPGRSLVSIKNRWTSLKRRGIPEVSVSSVTVVQESITPLDTSYEPCFDDFYNSGNWFGDCTGIGYGEDFSLL